MEDSDVQEVLDGFARRCSANSYGINNPTCMNRVQRSSICRSGFQLRDHVLTELAPCTMSGLHGGTFSVEILIDLGIRLHEVP